jgi:hypothetical protein
MQAAPADASGPVIHQHGFETTAFRLLPIKNLVQVTVLRCPGRFVGHAGIEPFPILIVAKSPSHERRMLMPWTRSPEPIPPDHGNNESRFGTTGWQFCELVRGLLRGPSVFGSPAVAHVPEAGFGTIKTSRDSLIMLSGTNRV